MKTQNAIDAWSLEVVRGPDAGRSYALGSGAVVLGNALDGEPGIDLSDQERTAPRKMAARQARIDITNGSATLRDLDSPGGTFVNRQRVLPGEGRSLQAGDVIQLGGVQLRVSRAGTRPPAPTRPESRPAPPASPGPARTFLFAMKSGASCRSWDDFLTVSAQRWTDLRDELTSGRLAGFLASIGRPDLMPDPNERGTPDERLDAWIGRLPATRPAKPELDVHPRTLVIRAPVGGGTTRRKLQISNAGYRLLKTTVRVEPEGSSWLRISGASAGQIFVTMEADELTIEADLPETMNAPLSATIVLESNGGKIAVVVRAEPGASKLDEATSPTPIKRPASFGLRERIASQSESSRLVSWPIAASLLRALLAIADRLVPSAAGSPGLLGPAAVFAGIGAVLAGALSLRGRGEGKDLLPSTLAGAILGAMLAAILVALCRVIEAPFLGTFGSSWLISCLVWAVIAAGLAGTSRLLIPARLEPETTP
ncbi:MAG: hypothetical protein JWN86_4486 [Planctomycetota bacterium]|nr:hypothetical protein [Planctomycetota bacterium]